MIRKVFAGSRFIVALAVVTALVSSMALLLAAVLTVIQLVRVQFTTFSMDGLTVRKLEHLGVQFIQLTDTILLGTVLYIIALGLHQLFVDPNLPVPPWMRVRDLMQLKQDLIGVTVVLLGVTFLGEVVEWQEGIGILNLGAAIALVVASLGFILRVTPRHDEILETDANHTTTKHDKPNTG